MILSVVAAACLYEIQSVHSPAVASPGLDAFVPEGALLYIEAKDFAGLLRDWNNSPEKATWLESDDHTVFSQSRLFLRLHRFFERFEKAAGVPANTSFAVQAAGEESALALYDIGKLEFVYVSRLHSTGFVHSDLWKSRNKLQPRSAAGTPFYLGRDDESGHVVGFAVAGDYLVLSTREDLIVRTLQLINKQPERSLHQEAWFTTAWAAAPQSPGDLRMVLDLKRISMERHFTSYWIQQNISEMEGYTAAICDLYREGSTYREERVLLRKAMDQESTQSEHPETISTLLAALPEDHGFYRVRIAAPDAVLSTLQESIMAPLDRSPGVQHQAPQVVLTSGEVGSASDLETRLDVPLVRGDGADSNSPALRRLLENTGTFAFLEVQGTHPNVDGVLLTTPTLLVMAASQPWDRNAVQQAIRAQLAPHLSTSGLGLQWKQVNEAEGWFELDGLHPLQIAVRDKLLYVSTQPEMLQAALQSHATPRQQPNVTYIAGFNHTRERENFYKLSKTIDSTPESTSTWGTPTPKFFSRNIAGLSQTLARLDSEEIVEREESGRVLQTVTFRWSQ
ncbi:MAG: hypothetical protein DMG65_05890 [Candidatus Angelobacter sp. Gp1-AA117]|nr:MAG: hypothetical protein DMG65_05890 [Candidatus Angelobacter sp. Gp1-AA117]